MKLKTWKIMRYYAEGLQGRWPNEQSVCQLSRRPGFNSRLSHTKDYKNGTWCHLAENSALLGKDQGQSGPIQGME